MLKIIRLTLLLFILVFALTTIVEAQVNAPVVSVIVAKGAINPVIRDFISRGIEQAEEDRAEVCVIQLDTPGGLDTSMRDIIKDIVNSRVPVAVYVSPSGARAASAGVFITMAAHIAVMAPNTAIGAASPVALSPEGEQQMSETMKNKVMNDASAYIRSIAQAHGRNMEWAEQAVREAVSATEQEALELNVIDMIAPDLNTLIAQLDGREVTLLGDIAVTIHTQGAYIHYIKMTWIEDFLYAISDPNIAYILLSLAMMGIMAEIFNPGLIFPGVVGAISLLLAFFSLGMLPVNWTGILLIVLAFGLFIGEVLTASFGLFTAGGVIALVAGSLILFQGAHPVFQIDYWLIATVTIIIALFFGFVLTHVVKIHRKQATTGREELTGKTALVKIALEPEGTVFYKGELWATVLDKGRAKPGEEVTITGVDGLTLQVTKKLAEEEN
ncbi:nodulation protein NfeD [Chloroflexota bacterium]